jgi:phospholipid-binding lipoprotein MlaA
MGVSLTRTAVVALALVTGSAAAHADPTHDAGPVHDAGRGTLETINSYIFGFNRWVTGSFGTVSEWDAAVAPEIASAMGNLFSTYINEPATIIAGLTAGDGATALHASKRLLINATLGFGGVFDAASTRGLPAKHLDWGLGACAQGVSDGPFVVIPLIGPRTSRDAILDVLPAQAIVFYGTYLVLGPFIGIGGVALLQFPELFVEALAFRQMDLEATGIEADSYETTRNRYVAYRQRRCDEYKADLAQRRTARQSGPRLASD